MNNSLNAQLEPVVKRRGFTLIELMVVVALIAILSTLLIVGVSKLQTNAKRQQTVQILENCRALWAEYDSIARLHFDPCIFPAPGNVTLESEISAEQSGTTADRLGLNIVLTRSIYALMRSQTNTRAAMDKFPANRMFLTSYTLNPSSAAYTTFFQNYTYMPGNSYQPYGGACLWTDPYTKLQASYLCIHANLQQATPPPPDTGYWLMLSGFANGTVSPDPTNPLLLDAWGNPIICCFGGALGSGKPLNSDGSIPAGSGVLKAGGRSVTVSSPDGRLFWASAGPDGDFSKGDDNLYSFEKP